MIDRNAIERLARLHGVKPFQEEKTYIQNLILRSIYIRVARDLIFKGGAALYLFYGLNRFSEDLDFTLTKRDNLVGLMNGASEDLQMIGVRGTVRSLQTRHDSESFKFSCDGPLYTTEVSRVTVKVEISTREEILLEPDLFELDPAYTDILPFTCPVMAIREIQAEKVRAILTRNKARDLFDLWFLFKHSSSEICTLDMINSKLSYYSTKYSTSEFVSSMEEKRSLWNSELMPVLIGRVPDVEGVIADVSKHMRGVEDTNTS